MRVANYFMAAAPKHGIFADLINQMRARAHLAVREDYDVFYTTGPDVISTVLPQVHHQYPDVVLLSTRELWVNFKHVITHSWREDAAVPKRPLPP